MRSSQDLRGRVLNSLHHLPPWHGLGYKLLSASGLHTEVDVLGLDPAVAESADGA